MYRILIVAAALMLAAVAPSAALANEPSQAATEAVEAGRTAYRAKDYATARLHFRTACDGNHRGACAALGILFRDGHGGPTDGFAARDAFRTACDLGHARACSDLGFMLRLGTVGVSRDLAGARDAYGKGCDAGDASACGNLGSMLLGGGPSADTRARNAFRTACDADLPVWCREYGQMLRDGVGGARDSAGAQAALAKGCSLGDRASCTAASAPAAPPRPAVPPPNSGPDGTQTPSSDARRITVEQDLFIVLERILNSEEPASRWTGRKVAALRDHVLSDNRLDDAERALITELSKRDRRPIALASGNGSGPFVIDAPQTTSLVLTTRLGEILEFVDLSIDPADRPGSLKRLFDASLRTPGATPAIRNALAGEVARLWSESTVDNGYGPVRGFITEAMGVVNTYEGEDNAAARTLLHASIEQGAEGAPVAMPRFLYNWIRPTGAGPQQPPTPQD